MLSYTDEVKKNFEARGKQMLCLVRSFGCLQNVSDGEKITGILCGLGCVETDCIDTADIIIYNTCAVRESAELKVFGLIGELKRLKEKNDKLIIGIAGCMAEESHVKDKILRSYRHVDFIMGTSALGELPRLIYEVIEERGLKTASGRFGHLPDEEATRQKRKGTIKANVTIMQGCDNFCSYCIVPYVRGRERSRKSGDIIAEIRELADKGFKEIMLLGQNVSSYGAGLNENIDFCGLLRKINLIDGDFKIRFMSSHPKDSGKELIDTILECEKVCKHLHLPLQSGSNRILEAMNRKYTAEKYLETVDYARSRIPDFSFSTDIIVGFPGETDEDFADTMKILEYVEYDNIFSFIYSKRSGTKAEFFEDNTPSGRKSERFQYMLRRQREIAMKANGRFVGRTLEVLFDGKSKKEGFITGKSDEFIIVEAETNDLSNIGKRKKVKITEAMIWAVKGEII